MEMEMARRKSEPNDAAHEAAVLADFINTTTILAKELSDNHEPIDDFPLDNADCATAAEIPGMPAKLKNKLQTMGVSFTTAEVATVLKCLAAAMAKAADPQASILAEITMKLGSCLMANVFPDTPASETTRQPKLTKTVYQFKITLLGVQPPIWRRIQVRDCTLDKLHTHIQNAMGWGNCHDYEFIITRFAGCDSELLDDEAESDPDSEDRLEEDVVEEVCLSQFLPTDGKPFSFRYEYDGGNNWQHEILFEGIPTLEPKAKLPRCLEGERACPPEDCGGELGFTRLLDIMEHPDHDLYVTVMETIGKQFKPEAFDAKQRTRAMQKNLR
jgi:hypothetical protein